MRIYWYWPHPHRQASDLALAMLRPDDRLTVQALPSLNGESFGPVTDYEVVRDLPDPSRPAATRVAGATREPRLALGRQRARSRLLRRGFDVAHLHLLDYLSDWRQLGRLGRSTALVSTVHDVRPHRSRLPPPMEWTLLRRLYRVAGTLVVAHQVLADELVADFGVSPERIHVIPPALPDDNLRDPTSVAPTRPFVLLLGALRENKGIETLVEAMRRSTGIELDAVIAGRGKPEFERRIGLLTRDVDSVRFEPGFVSAERKRELLSTASAVVMPYTSFHSQSAVLDDAYTHRVPVIVSDVGALGPTVRSDGTGLVLPPGDVDALAVAFAMVAAGGPGPEVEPNIGRAVERRSVDVVGRKLRAVYDTVARR